MKFKRLVDNLPAYKAGKVYSSTTDSLEMYRDVYAFGLGEEDSGYFIENDMGSGFYFSRRNERCKLKFDQLWERV